MTGPVPKPTFKRRRHPSGYIPPAVKSAVLQRSKGICEGEDCPDRRGDFRGLEFCHRYSAGHKTKGMGGTRRVCTVDDVWLGCAYCHNTIDHKLKEAHPIRSPEP